MADKDRRNIVVNGNKYRVTISESKRKLRVSVYDYDTFGSYYHKGPKANDIVTHKYWKGSVLWFGPDKSPSTEQVAQEALNEAVCIYEDKVERQEEYDERMREALGKIDEIHSS